MSIPDAQVRRLAESTFDRNVVVVAGAGTGKTTLLVNRFIHTLMREPNPVKVTEVVALTFTNKAATEMKIRLREHLMGLANAMSGPTSCRSFRCYSGKRAAGVLPPHFRRDFCESKDGLRRS